MHKSLANGHTRGAGWHIGFATEGILFCRFGTRTPCIIHRACYGLILLEYSWASVVPLIQYLILKKGYTIPDQELSAFKYQDGARIVEASL